MSETPNPPRPQVRGGVITFTIVIAGVFAWGITHLSSSVGFWLMAVSLFVVLSGSGQFAREYSIARHFGTAMGEVVDSQIVDTSIVPVQRHYWRYAADRVKYRFQAADGKFYHGVMSGYQLPTVLGTNIEIVYDTTNPAKNMPRDRVSFYVVPEVEIDLPDSNLPV